MRAVPIHEIPRLWAKIRPCLDKMVSKSGSDGWLVEDVYAILAAGNATLYVNDGEWLGFCVMQLLPNYTQRKLHVWVLHLESDPKQFMDRLKQVAVNAGCTKITFSTARKGWEKRAERLGFKPAMMNYEMEI